MGAADEVGGGGGGGADEVVGDEGGATLPIEAMIEPCGRENCDAPVSQHPTVGRFASQQ